jgi:subtilisin family serine protease
MKPKYLVTIIFFFFVVFCSAQKNEGKQGYYYYKGEKIILKINESRLVLFFDEDADFEHLINKEYLVSRKISPSLSLTSSQKRMKTIGLEVIIDDSKKYDEIYSSFKKMQKIKAIEQVVGDTLPVIISNFFYVKLKNETDTILLKQLAEENKTKIVRKISFSDKWYVLEVTKESLSNCLDISNIFAETNYFDKIDPGFVFDFSNNCVSDTRFNEQWAIDNTGIDINACNAWNLTTGNNDVVVAIIDMGIDNTHSEFTGTNFTTSYDAENRTTPAQIYADHGTHVCGIISSNHDQFSIAGVAPGLSIMEVSHPLTLISTLSEDLAAGINWAVQNGADVLNNSWGDQGGAFYNNLHSTLLEEAIDNAIENGRDGLGCVVLFASGNFSPEIDYPAYYRPEILTVGSISSTGQRSSFSGFGNPLDIVAPGSAILSTMRNNLYDTLSGTSMAAPHVSAVAGLILSINSNLSRVQVQNIIESTAQKVGGYTYLTTSGRTNGTWNNQMGYGLVDAYGAVVAAAGGPISGSSSVCTLGTTFSISPPASFDSIHWNVGSNLNITSGQGTTSCTIAATGYGTSYVSVNVIANGRSVTLPQKTVYAAIAVPPLNEISGPASIILNSTEHYTCDFLPRQASTYGIYNYDWTVTSKLQFQSSHSYQTDVYVKGITLGGGMISFYTTNGCGESTFIFPVRVVSAKSLNIYPNPASNEISVEIDDETKVDDILSDIVVSEQSADAEYLVSIYDSSGVPVYTKMFSNNGIKINTSGLQKGIYYVTLIKGNEKYAGSFIIE